MKKNKIGKFRKDLDGHSYFIPMKLLVDFDNMITNISLLEFYDEEFESSLTIFNNQYSKYKLKYPQEQYLCRLVIDIF